MPAATPTLPQKALVVLYDQLKRDTKKQGKALEPADLFGLIERRFDYLQKQGLAAAEAAGKKDPKKDAKKKEAK